MHKVISLTSNKEYWFDKGISAEDALVNTLLLEQGLEDELHTESIRESLKSKIKRGVYTVGLGSWVVYVEREDQVCGS